MNSYLATTGEPLGYCSIIPSKGEEHIFGDKLVQFSFAAGDQLFFTPIQYPRANLQIENNFRYHTPKEGQPAKYEVLRDKAKELAYLVDELCPNSRERSLAVTNLEQAVFWANASIARNE